MAYSYVGVGELEAIDLAANQRVVSTERVGHQIYVVIEETISGDGEQGGYRRVRELHQRDESIDVCLHCLDEEGASMPWPCPTMAALFPDSTEPDEPR